MDGVTCTYLFAPNLVILFAMGKPRKIFNNSVDHWVQNFVTAQKEQTTHFISIVSKILNIRDNRSKGSNRARTHTHTQPLKIIWSIKGSPKFIPSWSGLVGDANKLLPEAVHQRVNNTQAASSSHWGGLCARCCNVAWWCSARAGRYRQLIATAPTRLLSSLDVVGLNVLQCWRWR